MPRRVKGPDGTIHSFPDTATDQQISAALKAIPKVNVPATSKVPTWSDQLGLNTPTDSVVGGFFRGAGGAAVDMAQGAAAEVGNLMQKKLAAEQAPGLPLPAGVAPFPTREVPAALITQAPETTAGTIGTYAPTAAEMAIPGPTIAKGAKAAFDAIPRVAKAGEKFQNVMGAARHIPVDVSEVGDVALRIQQLAERGGSMPMAVRKILNRMTDPEKAPMLYEEARDFASNISRLSANEFGRLTPAVAREVATLRVALNKANAMAAKQAGKMDEYNAAMREYAQAMKIRGMVEAAVKGVKQNAPWLTLAGAAMWGAKKVTNAIGGGGRE